MGYSWGPDDIDRIARRIEQVSHMITVDIDHDDRPGYWRVTLRTPDGQLYTGGHRYQGAYITTGARAVIDGLHADGIPVTAGAVLALRLGAEHA